MKIRDFTWLKEEDIVAAGSDQYEILGVRHVNTPEEAEKLPDGQLAVVSGIRLLENEVCAEALLRALIKSKTAIGIRWPRSRESISRLPLLRETANRGIPVFFIPQQIGLEQLFTEITQADGNFYMRVEYRELIARFEKITAGEYDTEALLAFLREELKYPMDCFVGQALTSIAFYPSLGIFDLSRFIRNNARQLLSGPLMQIHAYGGLSVWTFNLQNPADFPAVLAVTLPQGAELDMLAVQAIEEVIPYLRISTLFDCRTNRTSDPKRYFLENIIMGQNEYMQVRLWESAHQLGLKQKTPYYVCIVDAVRDSRSDTEKRILAYVCTKEPDCVYIMQGHRIIFIVRAETLEKNGAADTFFRNMLSEIGEEPVTCGFKISISQVCSTIESLEPGFWEARFAMALGRQMDKDAFVYHYSQYILYNLLCDIWDNPIFMQIPQKTVDRLITYDKKYKTQLFTTLQTLLDSDFNIYLTASRMNAHRNTIHKRMGRINSLLDMDLNYYENRMLLQVAVIEKMLMRLCFTPQLKRK